jgi:hexosaminidase
LFVILNHAMKTLSLIVLAASLVAATADPLPLVPKPVSVETSGVSFKLSADTVILYSGDLESEAKLLAADIGKLTGSSPRVGEAGRKAGVRGPTEISLSLSVTDELPPSGYVLNTNNGTRLTIHGKDAAGVFHGTRTLLQLLPAKPHQGVSILIPGVKITDHPRFAWRGMMLDSGRHFVPVNDVKTFINQLALPQVQRHALASHRGSRLAHRDQKISQAHRGRRVA